MDSPLAYDDKIKKEFKIDDTVDQEHVFKLAHVRTQLEEIKKFLWRERVELILAETQATDANDVIADKGRSNATEKRNNIKQVVRSIRVLDQLQKELEAAAPKE